VREGFCGAVGEEGGGAREGTSVVFDGGMGRGPSLE